MPFMGMWKKLRALHRAACMYESWTKRCVFCQKQGREFSTSWGLGHQDPIRCGKAAVTLRSLT